MKSQTMSIVTIGFLLLSCFSFPCRAWDKVKITSFDVAGSELSLFAKEYSIQLIGGSRNLSTKGFVYFVEDSIGSRLWQRTYGDLKLIPQDRPRDFHIAGKDSVLLLAFVENSQVCFFLFRKDIIVKPIENDARVRLGEIKFANPEDPSFVVPIRLLVQEQDFLSKILENPPRIHSIRLSSDSFQISVLVGKERNSFSKSLVSGKWSVINRK